jgi:hemoglobin
MTTFSAALVSMAGCTTAPSETALTAKPLEDGQVSLPASYKSWPKFLTSVQRPDAKQVRDVYINPTGYLAKAGQPFAQGTTFVMENFSVKLDAAGNPVKGADGKLVKADLVRVFVMAKGLGYGAQVPPELKTGDWVFASYDATGNKTADSLAACRPCHVPLASKDFVARYDEYFVERGKGY